MKTKNMTAQPQLTPLLLKFQISNLQFPSASSCSISRPLAPPAHALSTFCYLLLAIGYSTAPNHNPPLGSKEFKGIQRFSKIFLNAPRFENPKACNSCNHATM